MGDDQSQGVGSRQMTKLPELFHVEPTAARRAKETTVQNHE
jgi:hypothetical protein